MISGDKKRLDWVDALKGFLMFCVTIGHCNAWEPVERYIYSFHMFLFLFLSGFLFAAKAPTKELLKKCIKKLLLPFVLWNVLSASVALWLTGDKRNFVAELLVINGNLTWNPTIWFLLVLFLAQSIIIAMKLYRKRWIAVLTIVLCLGLWVRIGDKWLLWKANLVPMAMAFFLLGYLLKGAIAFFQKWYIIILSGLGSVAFSMMNIRIVYTYGRFGNYAFCMLAAFCGVVFFVGVFSRLAFLARVPCLKSWGKNSLAIMAMQYFVFKLIKKVSLRFLQMDLMLVDSTALALAITIFTIGVIMLLVFLYKELAKRVKFIRVIGEAFGIS